jgi:adenylate cyclase
MNNEERRQEHRLLSFEPFRLDVRNAQLWQGPEVIRLTSKALAVLCYLAERSGQLVTKDELFAAVWPGVVVSDSALVACIGELRRALGDARRTPRFIETVHGRGYRFIAPLSTQDSDAQPALPLPDKSSIVVLPFVNMSGDLEQEYFSDGMTEDLITDLSKLSGLFVIARNSSFYYKGKAVKMEEVSRALGVQYVLEGSVRKADSQIRITAQLVDATTSYHLWAERYDRELQDIFALQDDIRQKIVTALRVKLLPEEQERLKYFPTNNLEAYTTSCAGRHISSASPKKQIGRRGRCLRRPLSWTSSMQRRTQSWG